jgi:hypothetical protein
MNCVRKNDLTGKILALIKKLSRRDLLSSAFFTLDLVYDYP